MKCPNCENSIGDNSVSCEWCGINLQTFETEQKAEASRLAKEKEEKELQKAKEQEEAEERAKELENAQKEAKEEVNFISQETQQQEFSVPPENSDLKPKCFVSKKKFIIWSGAGLIGVILFILGIIAITARNGRNDNPYSIDIPKAFSDMASDGCSQIYVEEHQNWNKNEAYPFIRIEWGIVENAPSLNIAPPEPNDVAALWLNDFAKKNISLVIGGTGENIILQNQYYSSSPQRLELTLSCNYIKDNNRFGRTVLIYIDGNYYYQVFFEVPLKMREEYYNLMNDVTNSFKIK